MSDINDFLGGYLVVTTHYLVVTTSYNFLPGGYCLLLVVTARYLLVPTFSMNGSTQQFIKSN